MDNAIIENLSETSNSGDDTIEAALPLRVSVTIEGSANFLFHRWQNEAVIVKDGAGRGSKAKKTDNVESYVYRLDDGKLAMPTEYLRQSIIHAAKFRSDPRSSRKSAMDLYKAGVIALSNLASFGKPKWDYLDSRRAVVQRSGITRTRPAMLKGWRTTHELLVTTPEYISATDLREVIEVAGRLVGVGDFRPSFGRFGIVQFKVLKA